MPEIKFLDLIFIILSLFLIIKASLIGFIAEFFPKAAVLLGGFTAVLFYKPFTIFLKPFLKEDKTLLPIISFLIIFLSVYLIIKLLELMIGSLFTGDSLVNLDMSLGFFLGIAESLAVIVCILILLKVQPFFPAEKILLESKIAYILDPLLLN